MVGIMKEQATFLGGTDQGLEERSSICITIWIRHTSHDYANQKEKAVLSWK